MCRFVALTFGEDQKGFKLQFLTDEGKASRQALSPLPLIHSYKTADKHSPLSRSFTHPQLRSLCGEQDICAKMRAFATELAVNLRKESLEQMATPALHTKLAEMQDRLRRAEARESGSFKKHTKLQAEITAVEEVLATRGADA